MARRKVIQDAVKERPTWEAIKAKQGKYVIASYRGYDIGGVSIPAPDAYELGLPVGYVPKELVIEPWVWKVIQAYWLEDGRFAALYERIPGLCIDRVDTLPPTQVDLAELPSDLTKKLTEDRKQKAFWIATQPYYPNARTGDPKRATADLIQMRDMETTDDSPQQISFLQDELAPLLQAALIFEERLGNRPEVVRDIQKRLEDIGGKKPFRSTRRRQPVYT